VLIPFLVSCGSNDFNNNITNISNPQLPSYSPTENSKPNDNNLDGYIDESKNPEKFVSRNIFDLDEIKSKSQKEIFESTPLYKSSLNNFYWSLKNYNNGNGFDFINTLNQNEMTKDFYALLKNIGVYGNYGSGNYLVKYFPNSFKNENLLEKQALNSFDSTKSSIQEISDDVSINSKINEIVLNNPFGFLPSNLSEYFSYIKISDIANLFQLSNIIDIYANYDDKKGEINLFFKSENNTIQLYKLDKNKLSNLKNDHDFYQYIYDRSFFMKADMWTNRYYAISKSAKFEKDIIGGTFWVFDRVYNDNLKSDEYEFLVGTNLHVLDLTRFFDWTYYNNYLAFEREPLKSAWNGGFRSVIKSGNNVGGSYEQIQDFTSSERNIKYQTLKRTNTNRIPFNMQSYNERNVDNISDSKAIDNYIDNSYIGSDNYMDLVWYTPNFSSDFIAAENDYDAKLSLDEYNPSNRIGKVNNAGADFAVTKLKMKKSEIQKILPALYNVLGTEKEKDWYMGLGNDELISANRTIYTAGYPSGVWNKVKSESGRIMTKNRNIVHNEEIHYWTKYDEALNKKLNSRNDFYKKYIEPFGPKDSSMVHGMGIRKSVQNSVLQIHSKDDNYLTGGGSGSMAIDSRFNLVGATFMVIYPPNTTNFYDTNPISNFIGLFNSYENYNNWDGNINKDIVKKLKEESTYTYK
ncbi:MAG: DUF31 family protein, partial [Malacoplasma sp.]|nr:DUF31 family protein [Malacoplasma sp.]